MSNPVVLNDSDDDLPPPPPQAPIARAPVTLDSDDDLPPPPPKTAVAAPAISLDSDDDLPPPPPQQPAAAKPVSLDSDDDLPPPPRPAPAPAASAPPTAAAAPSLSAPVASPPRAYSDPAVPASPTASAPSTAASPSSSTVASSSPQRRARPKSMASISHEGFLFKQSPSWPYAQQKRWVTLKGRLVSYYEDKAAAAGSAATGTIDLSGPPPAQLLEQPPAAKMPHSFGIAGESAALKGRTFIFSAPSREEYEAWFRVLSIVTEDPKAAIEVHWFEKMAQGLW